MPFGFPPRGAASGVNPAASPAMAAGLAFYPAFTGFAFTKLGMNPWGAGPFFNQALVEGGALVGNGNTGMDVLSFKAAINPTTVPWFTQWRTQIALPAANDRGGVAMATVDFLNWIIFEQKASFAPNMSVSFRSGGGAENNFVTTFVNDAAWHTFGMGFDGTNFRITVDGAQVYSLAALAPLPILPLSIAVMCTTFTQPNVAWFAYSYVAP